MRRLKRSDLDLTYSTKNDIGKATKRSNLPGAELPVKRRKSFKGSF